MMWWGVGGDAVRIAALWMCGRRVILFENFLLIFL